MYTFFWNGPFSNWYPSFFELDMIKFSCEEQHMMYSKAMFFGDTKSASKILLTKDPSIQKAIGRSVHNFDENVWSKVSGNIVYKGLREKFTQNPELYGKLVSTGNTTLVEASPVDRIWGIGFFEDEALENIDKWGENRLGKLLTKLRDELKSEL